MYNFFAKTGLKRHRVKRVKVLDYFFALDIKTLYMRYKDYKLCFGRVCSIMTFSYFFWINGFVAGLV